MKINPVIFNRVFFYICFVHFTSCKNIQELKTKYKKLCFKLHPDKGGNSADFQIMQNEFIQKLSELQKKKPNKEFIYKYLLKKKPYQEPEINLVNANEIILQTLNLLHEIKKKVRRY